MSASKIVIPGSGDPNKYWSDLRKGNRAALDELFRLFYDQLFAFGIKIIGNQEQVKDGIQEVFFSIWKNREGLAEAISVKAYLLASLRRNILKSKLLEENRELREKEYYGSNDFEEFVIQDFTAKSVKDKKKKKQLIEGLNKLSNRQRETLYLKYYHGLTNKEIAEVMDINHQSVKNNVARGILNLKKLLTSSPQLLFILLKNFS